MQKSMKVLVPILLLALYAQSSQAGVISWTDWTSATKTPNQVLGNLTVGLTTVGVTFSGEYSFAQTDGGTNYWNPSTPYMSATVDNAPPASDIIALSTGGTKTIAFSQPVQDPLVALVSWNNNTVDFGVPIEVLSFGAGYFGNGTPVVNGDETGFFGSGEVHGVIRLLGSYSSITFTDTVENWHGLTVGVVGLANPTIPAPGAFLLAGIGSSLVGYMRRRRSL